MTTLHHHPVLIVQMCLSSAVSDTLLCYSLSLHGSQYDTGAVSTVSVVNVLGTSIFYYSDSILMSNFLTV